MVGTRRDVLVIGASAGGLEPLQRILADLDGHLKAAAFVVIHTAAEAPGFLPAILRRAGPFDASFGINDEPIVDGRIYVAPPDHHLLIEPGRVRITRGPKENGFRPAVDPLFRTAAEAYGPRVIGLVLSGGQNDGTIGLSMIKAAGGVAIVQAPDDAQAPGMPDSAIRHVPVDYVAPAADIARILATLQAEPMKTKKSRQKSALTAVGQPPDRAEVGTDLLHTATPAGGRLTVFTCPECGGPLWEREESGLLRFRCHVGHAFTGEALVNEQADAVEQAMWTALRALEEGAALRERMAAHAGGRGMAKIAADYSEQAREMEGRAAVIRRALVVDDATRDEASTTSAVAARAKRASRR